MSMLGIGSAKIDLILPKDTYHPGDYIKGFFLVKGGTIEQLIKRIECDLVMIDQISGSEKVIDHTTVLSSKIIHSEESSHISFTFKLPELIPFSSEERSFRFKTRLTFSEGVESRDQDYIQIIPQFI